ncbi:hypothetical protein JCM8547_000759 [Rhodosporidiobolus lusitaniae]
MLSTALTLLALLPSAPVSVQAHPLSLLPKVATPKDLALIDAQYHNSGLDLDGNAGFGIPLRSRALLSLVYPSSIGLVENGKTYPVDSFTYEPEVYITPSEETAWLFNDSATYTVFFADASSLGDPDVRGNYLHFLGNGYHGSTSSRGKKSLTFKPHGGKVISEYFAPGPLPGTGPHRYSYLYFAEPHSFRPPANLSEPDTPSAPIYVADYVRQTGVKLLAASWFTTEPNGEPTGPVAVTQTVNPATLVVPAPTGKHGGKGEDDQKKW